MNHRNYFFVFFISTIFSVSCDKNTFSGSSPSKRKPEPTNGIDTASASVSSKPSDCFDLPLESQKVIAKSFGNKFRNTLFHKVVAVDPQNTGNDPSVNHGLNPFVPSPPSELNQTDFSLNFEQLKAIAAIEGNEFEAMVFAHQFGSGLDRISLEVNTGLENFNDISNTNIYSAYGYISVKNMRIEGEKIFGDLDVFSFNYDPNGVGSLYDKIRETTVSAQDGTDISGPASENTTPNKSKKNVELKSLTVRVGIDAASYDSVQYRALRISTWSRESLENVKVCP